MLSNCLFVLVSSLHLRSEMSHNDPKQWHSFHCCRCWLFVAVFLLEEDWLFVVPFEWCMPWPALESHGETKLQSEAVQALSNVDQQNPASPSLFLALMQCIIHCCFRRLRVHLANDWSCLGVSSTPPDQWKEWIKISACMAGIRRCCCRLHLDTKLSFERRNRCGFGSGSGKVKVKETYVVLWFPIPTPNTDLSGTAAASRR